MTVIHGFELINEEEWDQAVERYKELYAARLEELRKPSPLREFYGFTGLKQGEKTAENAQNSRKPDKGGDMLEGRSNEGSINSLCPRDRDIDTPLFNTFTRISSPETALNGQKKPCNPLKNAQTPALRDSGHGLIKAPLDSPELFARSTGLGSVEVAARFLEALKASLSLASSAPFLELRITLVPGILDDADTIRRTVLGVGDVMREGGRRVLVFQQFVPYPTVRDQKFRSVPRTDPGFAKKLAELASRLVDYEVYVRTLEEGVTPIRVQGPACPP